MRDNIKQAIERLRAQATIKFDNLHDDDQDYDILDVCDYAEKAMRVVEAAKDVHNDAQGGLTGNCWRVGKTTMNLLSEALAAMEEQ